MMGGAAFVLSAPARSVSCILMPRHNYREHQGCTGGCTYHGSIQLWQQNKSRSRVAPRWTKCGVLHLPFFSRICGFGVTGLACPVVHKWITCLDSIHWVILFIPWGVISRNPSNWVAFNVLLILPYPVCVYVIFEEMISGTLPGRRWGFQKFTCMLWILGVHCTSTLEPGKQICLGFFAVMELKSVLKILTIIGKDAWLENRLEGDFDHIGISL